MTPDRSTAALITGASSGIGEEFARQLAAGGHNLVLVARSEQKLQELCDQLMLKHKITARSIALDLTWPDADRVIFEETEKQGCSIDLLINNAGFGSAGDFCELDIDRELRMIDLNISALVAMTHRYLCSMREAGRGRIINVSSAAGFQAIPFMATYAATKAFVTSFSEALAEENRPFGIQVMALCPGSTKTNFFAASEIDKPIKVKGQQTAEQVVDTALRAMKNGRTRVVSGGVNKIGAAMGRHLPTFISRRLLGSILRDRFQITGGAPR